MKLLANIDEGVAIDLEKVACPRGVTKASLRAGFGIQTTTLAPVIGNNAQLAGFKAKVKR